MLLALDSAENSCFLTHKTWLRWFEPYLWSQFWRVTKRNGLSFEAGSDTYTVRKLRVVHAATEPKPASLKTLFCLKGLSLRHVWKTGALSFAFWSINIGLALMVLLSDLPRGLLQTVASVEHGMWYARCAEFMQTELMNILRWLRVIGDTIFVLGVLALGWFVLGVKLGWSLTGQPDEIAREFPEPVPVK